MNCLRCGAETENEHVFCDSCRAVMAQHPVKPGTPVHIPQRATAPAPQKKAAPRRVSSPKETIRQMRGLIHWLTATIAVLTVVICLLVGFLMYTMDSTQEVDNIGKNYNTASTTQPD